MAQFDVHRNPGRGRADIPNVVIVQSRAFDGIATRLVAPLVLAGPDDPWRYPARMPRFMIEERRVVIDPLLLQPVPVKALGVVVASLADDNDAVSIISAIDEVITRAHG